MFDFLRTLFTGDETPSFDDVAGLDTAIARIIAGTDPRLKLLPDHRERLAPAAAAALEHARACVAALAAPHRLDREAFARDPLIHACFGSADDISRTINEDPTIRDWLATPHGHAAPALYVLLALTCEERGSFGVQLDNGVLHRDVPQTVVNFTRPVFLAPAANEAGCREAVVWIVFDYCVQRALERLTELRERREELETRYRLHLGKLRALDRAHRGLGAIAGQGSNDADRSAAEQELADIEEQLQAAVADTATLDDYLTRIVEVLSAPEALITVAHRQLRLDRVGIRLDDPSLPGDDVDFEEATFAQGLRRVPVLVRIPGVDLEAPAKAMLPQW